MCNVSELWLYIMGSRSIGEHACLSKVLTLAPMHIIYITKAYIYNMIANMYCDVAVQADVMLVKNAQNLMEAVIKTMREAEAACMKVRTTSLSS